MTDSLFGEPTLEERAKLSEEADILQDEVNTSERKIAEENLNDPDDPTNKLIKENNEFIDRVSGREPGSGREGLVEAYKNDPLIQAGPELHRLGSGSLKAGINTIDSLVALPQQIKFTMDNMFTLPQFRDQLNPNRRAFRPFEKLGFSKALDNYGTYQYGNEEIYKHPYKPDGPMETAIELGVTLGTGGVGWFGALSKAQKGATAIKAGSRLGPVLQKIPIVKKINWASPTTKAIVADSMANQISRFSGDENLFNFIQNLTPVDSPVRLSLIHISEPTRPY